MSQEQHSPIASRLLLGKMLRRLREEAGLSGVETADQMDFGTAKLSKIEQGHTPVTKSDLKLFFEVLSVPADLQPTLLDLGAQARRTRRSRTTTSEEALPGRKFEKYLGLEEVAVRVKDWQTHLIPGILQTPEYARALIHAANPTYATSRVDHLVQLRMDRQRALHRESDPLKLWSIMEEHALRRVVGGGDTHATQLQHLLEMGHLPHVNIQVIPMSYGEHSGLDGAFAILDVGNEYPPVVYVESRGRNTYIESVDELASYQASYDHIQSAALSPKQSAEAIMQIVKESQR